MVPGTAWHVDQGSCAGRNLVAGTGSLQLQVSPAATFLRGLVKVCGPKPSTHLVRVGSCGEMGDDPERPGIIVVFETHLPTKNSHPEDGCSRLGRPLGCGDYSGQPDP